MLAVSAIAVRYHVVAYSLHLLQRHVARIDLKESLWEYVVLSLSQIALSVGVAQNAFTA